MLKEPQKGLGGPKKQQGGPQRQLEGHQRQSSRRALAAAGRLSGGRRKKAQLVLLKLNSKLN